MEEFDGRESTPPYRCFFWKGLSLKDQMGELTRTRIRWNKIPRSEHDDFNADGMKTDEMRIFYSSPLFDDILSQSENKIHHVSKR